jgi:hypothetical protein
VRLPNSRDVLRAFHALGWLNVYRDARSGGFPGAMGWGAKMAKTDNQSKQILQITVAGSAESTIDRAGGSNTTIALDGLIVAGLAAGRRMRWPIKQRRHQHQTGG